MSKIKMKKANSNLAKLPKFCYAYHPGTKEPIRIFKGESGYHPPAKDDVWVEEINGLLGVTVEQEEAMLAGSMFGWDNQLADPDFYLNNPKWQAQAINQGRKPALSQPRELDKRACDSGEVK